MPCPPPPTRTPVFESSPRVGGDRLSLLPTGCCAADSHRSSRGVFCSFAEVDPGIHRFWWSAGGLEPSPPILRLSSISSDHELSSPIYTQQSTTFFHRSLRFFVFCFFRPSGGRTFRLWSASFSIAIPDSAGTTRRWTLHPEFKHCRFDFGLDFRVCSQNRRNRFAPNRCIDEELSSPCGSTWLILTADVTPNCAI